MIVCGSRSLTFSPLGFECGLQSRVRALRELALAVVEEVTPTRRMVPNAEAAKASEVFLHNVTEGEGLSLLTSRPRA